MLILMIIAVGMAAGYFAHLILQRGAPLDWTRLFIAGVVGSFIGGLIFSLIAGDGLALRPSGLVGSILGAVIVLAVMPKKAMTATPRTTNNGRVTPKKRH